MAYTNENLLEKKTDLVSKVTGDWRYSIDHDVDIRKLMHELSCLAINVQLALLDHININDLERQKYENFGYEAYIAKTPPNIGVYLRGSLASGGEYSAVFQEILSLLNNVSGYERSTQF